MKLILASASESRARILTAVAVPFAIVPAEIDEDRVKEELLAHGKDPADISVALAKAKALAVSRMHDDAWVLGADQVLRFGAELVSKCADLVSARRLLSRLKGQPHELISALALARSGSVHWSFSDTAVLKMRNFSDDFLDAYLLGEGTGLLSGVGCYRIEGRGAQLFDTVEGDYFSIQGLPLHPLLAELRLRGLIAT